MLTIRTTTATLNEQGAVTNITRNDSKRLTAKAAKAAFAAVTIPAGATVERHDDDTLTFVRPDDYQDGYTRRTTIGIRWLS